MPQPILDFYNSILTKNWFAVAALAIMLGTQLVKRLPWLSVKIWVKLPVGYRFLVPIVAAMAAAFVHGFVAHETLTASIWDVVKIAFTAMGGAAALKESPLPWDGGKGGTPLPPAAPSASPPAAAAPPPPPDLIVEVDNDKTPIDGLVVPNPPTEPPPPKVA